MSLCKISRRRGAMVLLAAFFSLLAPVFAYETSFLADIDALPLAPGLTEDAASRVAFDKPEGRIVQALARGRADPAAVRTFYAETLPALGWRTGVAGEWSRGRETLRVDVENAEGGVVVRIAIAPRAVP